MASSKTLLILVAVLFTANTVLLVVAREMTETTSNTVDTSSDNKSKGEVNDVKYPGAAAYGGCICCGRKIHYTICICCDYANNQKPDADYAAVTVSP